MTDDATINRSDRQPAVGRRWDPRDYTREELLAQIRANLDRSLAIRGTDADPLVRAQQALDRLAARRF